MTELTGTITIKGSIDVAITAELIGRIGGGIEWHDLPAFDEQDEGPSSVVVSGAAILLAIAPEGTQTVILDGHTGERFATFKDFAEQQETVAAAVFGGSFIIIGTALGVSVPTRYAVLPMED